MRINPRLRVGLLLLVLAGVAFGIRSWLKKRPRLPHFGPAVSQVTVVVASADIPAQTILTNDPALLRTETMPLKDAGSLLTVKNLDEVKGYLTKYRIVRGYRIDKTWIAGKIDQLGISYLIPEGKRAMVIDLKKTPNFFDMIKAGDHVDVIGTYPTADDPAYTRPIVFDALVLAVNTKLDGLNVAQRGESKAPAQPPGQPAGGQPAAQPAGGQQGKAPPPQQNPQQQQQPPPEPHNITLALTPQDAVLIALSNKAGLDVILRPPLGMGTPSYEISTGPTPGAGGAELVEPRAKPSARTETKSLASLSPGIALTDVAPPLKKKEPQAQGGNPPPRPQPVPPRPRPGFIFWRPTGIPRPPKQVGGGLKPMPVSQPTYEVQLFKGSARSSVEVKKPSDRASN